MKVLLLPAALVIASLCGCAMPSPDCTPISTAYIVSPASATASHVATAPGNQQQFSWFVSYTYAGGGHTAPESCNLAVPAIALPPYQTVWTSSDPINAPISSAHDDTNGVATCVGATTGAATMTAYPSDPRIATAQFTCQ